MKKDIGKRLGIRPILIAILFGLLIQMIPTQAVAADTADGRQIEIPEKYRNALGKVSEDYYVPDDAEHITKAPDPNELAIERSREEKAQQPGIRSFASTYALPRVVDNSTLKYFPPIGDQGSLGSCAAFSTTYYSYTYARALARDIDVKSTGNSEIMSPAFTYPLVNCGKDIGSYSEDIIRVIRMIGSLPLSQMPYSDTDYTTWPTTADKWREAIRNKASNWKIFEDPSYGVDDTNIVKQYLANGHIISMVVRIGDFAMYNAQNNPNSTNDDAVVGKPIGDHRPILGNTRHGMTIVGYNDDIWADYNGNGIIDADELGAYKIANSWGTGDANNGFFWMSYRSYKKSIMGNPVVIFADADPYEAKILAEIDVETNSKYNMDFNIGIQLYGTKVNSFGKATTMIGSTDDHPFVGTMVFDMSAYIDQQIIDPVTQLGEWYVLAKYPDITSFKLTDANGNVLAVCENAPKKMNVNGTSYYAWKIIYGMTTPSGSYSVTWQPNNGDSSTTETMSGGSKINVPTAPVNGDELFGGWYTDARFIKKVEFPYFITKNTTFYAKWGTVSSIAVPDNDGKGFYIDLDSESLLVDSSFTIAAYSIDGGAKWKKGTPNIPTLLNKKMNLSIADSYDSATKKPSATFSETINFPTTEARPKSNPDKLVINYAICDDKTGRTAGAWTLSKKGGKEAFTGNIEIAPSKNKKTPDRDGDEYPWQAISEDGIPVQPYGSPKQIYLARTAPVADGERYVPASKPFKLTPLTLQKAPKWKPKYKYSVSGLLSNTEAFSLRPGDFIFGGSYETLKNTENPVVVKSNYEFGVGIICEAERGGVPVSVLLDKATAGNPAVVCIWKYATEKKPASEIQEYTLAYRSVLSPQTITAASNGKITFPSTLEVYDKSKNKWGSLPKFTSTVTLEGAVRLKTTVRPTGKDDSSQLAASKPMDLTINYGVNPTTNKSGILSIVISEPNDFAAVQAEQFDVEELPQENDENQEEMIEQDENEQGRIVVHWQEAYGRNCSIKTVAYKSKYRVEISACFNITATGFSTSPTN